MRPRLRHSRYLVPASIVILVVTGTLFIFYIALFGACMD